MKVTREDYFITETRAGSFRPWNSFTIYRLNIVGLIKLYEAHLVVQREKDPERRREYIKLGISWASNVPVKKLRYVEKHMLPYRVGFFDRLFHRIPVNETDLFNLWNHIVLFNFPMPHSWEIPNEPEAPKTIEEARTQFLANVFALIRTVSRYFEVDYKTIMDTKNIWQLYLDHAHMKKEVAIEHGEQLNIALAQHGGAKELFQRYSNEAVGSITIKIGDMQRTYARKKKEKDRKAGEDGGSPAPESKPDAGDIQ